MTSSPGLWFPRALIARDMRLENGPYLMPEASPQTRALNESAPPVVGAAQPVSPTIGPPRRRPRRKGPWLPSIAITITVAIIAAAAVAQGHLLNRPLNNLIGAALIEGVLVGLALAVIFVVAPARRAEEDRQWLISCLRDLAQVDRRKSFSVLLEQVEEHSIGEIAKACHDALATAHRDRLEAATLRREMDARVTQQTRQAVAHISRISNTDDLSGLYNRRGFDAALSEAFVAARRAGQPLSLLALDLDNFKQLNDSLGHAKGDEAIRAAGEILAANLRVGDAAGRSGGDEFLVLLANTDSQSARHIAERFVRLYASHPAGTGLTSPWPTMSVGVACSREHKATSPDHLKQLADEALYQAKRAGRDATCVYGEAARAA